MLVHDALDLTRKRSSTRHIKARVGALAEVQRLHHAGHEVRAMELEVGRLVVEGGGGTSVARCRVAVALRLFCAVFLAFATRAGAVAAIQCRRTVPLFLRRFNDRRRV